MLERYEKIVSEYKLWHPALFNETIECRPSGHRSILVTLKDGSRLEYNSADHTIRNVTRFYDHNSTEALDEQAWRKEFGQKLRRAISDKGINQERLSELTGISRQMLSRYITGNSTPSGYIITRLSETLNCDVRELTRFGYIDEE